MKAMLPFKHAIPIQIRFSDIDRLNHVNNAVYHQYVELGRVNYFNTVLKDLVDWNLQGFVLARTEMDFLISLTFGQNLMCYSRVYEIGNKSLKTETHLYCVEEEPKLAVLCKGVLVCMDYVQNKSILIPEIWRTKIYAYEGIS